MKRFLQGQCVTVSTIGERIRTFILTPLLPGPQIERAQSSLSGLLLFELEQLPGVPLDDVQEVSNYVAVGCHGLQHLAERFPISLCLIREM